MPRARTLAAAIVVAVLAVSVAAPSLRYGFVYDDEAVVLERHPFWELGARGFLESRPWGTGRHLTAVSLDLDRLHRWRLPSPAERPEPLAFHRTNLALYALLSVMVLVLLGRLGFPPAAALVGASLFAVHPVHVDAVVWIVGRAELLAALAVVGAMTVAIRREPPPLAGSPWPIAATVAVLALAGLHAKENAIVLPLLLVVARVLLGPRVAITSALAGTAVAVALWGLQILPRMGGFVQPQFVDNPLVYATFFERLPKAMEILARYAALLVWPHPLLPDRSWAQTDPGLVSGWIATAAWAVAAVATWRLRRSQPIAVLALAWFPAAFAVTANVISPIGVLMAERLLLLPSVSIALLTAEVARRLARTPTRTGAVALATMLAVAACFGLFRARAAVWESPEVYFAASAAAAPRSAKAQYDLAQWQNRRGRRAEAEAAYARALAIDPSLTRAAQHLAESMADRGDPAAGAEVYLRYLQSRPEDAGAVKNATRLLLQAGRGAEAIRMAQRLVELKPGDPDALEALVTAEAIAGRELAKPPAVSP